MNDGAPLGLRLASWHESLPPGTLGGSLYAVPPELRIAAARALAASRCTIHADLIIDGSGRHVGVTPEEVTAVRKRLPSARIDAHLIVTATSRTAAVRAAIDDALGRLAGLGITVVAASRELMLDHAAPLAALRSGGVALWAEVAPDDDGAHLSTDTVDGALVMFIPPGSAEKADPRHLDKLPAIAALMPVGVDGGITADLSYSCIDAGASHIVSGRALLRPEAIENSPPTQTKERTA